jgi:multidrug efflux pump subunit AcrA (membrane-fusion protein)
MHHVLSADGARQFPGGKRLISHWNLRDELKANYADPQGLSKQRTIVRVMERIVSQTIPAAVIDNPHLDWNPFTNAVTLAPASSVEADAPKRAVTPSAAPEPDVRYQRLLANAVAQRKADPYSPMAASPIDRAFGLGGEMPEARVRELLLSVLTSPQAAKVAAEIRRRVGRPLEPVDLWYNGFLPRGRVPEAELDAKVRARYPTADAFAKERFKAVLAFINPDVDPARGSVEVKLSVPEPPDYLREDMTVSVDIEVARRPNTLVLPANAVRDSLSATPWVLAVVDGKTLRRPVTVGARGAALIEILDGLAEGDSVVPAMDRSAKPGQRVRVRLM